VPDDTDKLAATAATAATDRPDDTFIISAIRLGCLALLAYWAWLLLQPFLAIILWSVIFAVALYPVFDWLATRLHVHRAVVAAAITVFSLILIFGPVTWLGLSLGDNVRTLYERLSDGSLAIPAPYESVKAWPVFGEQAYQIWYLASTNFTELIGEWAPQLKLIGSSVLAIAGTWSSSSSASSSPAFYSCPGRIWSSRSRAPCGALRPTAPKSSSR
jgi:predicted PurR-regulated permease PerM